jgi:hypothetical protein
MSDYATFEARINGLAKDTADELNTFDIQDALREALTTYDADVPRQIIEDLSGDGTKYDFTLTNWVDRFSSISNVEYPTGERPARYLEDDDFIIYRTATTTGLRLQELTPGTGQTVRVTYTARHTIDGLDGATTTTVLAWHENAVVSLAASRCLLRFATRYLHEQGGSMLDADVVDRQSKSDIARRLAGTLAQSYRDELRIESGVVAAGGVIDWDLSFAGSGAAKLTHPKRWR